LQASEKGGLIHQMHKTQSYNAVTIAEFDNLRELNAHAIEIARDYFAMAANDPRREETAREILRLSRHRSLMERAVATPPSPPPPSRSKTRQL